MYDWILCIQQHTSEFISINLIETIALVYMSIYWIFTIRGYWNYIW